MKYDDQITVTILRTKKSIDDLEGINRYCKHIAIFAGIVILSALIYLLFFTGG